MAYPCRVLKSRQCEINQFYNPHLGLDLVGKDYTLDKIIAHSSGKVIMTQTGKIRNPDADENSNESYGNFIKIDHGDNCYTLYAHLKELYVSNGQEVTEGQEIGMMGDTGRTFGGAHLHFEVWKNNTRTDPYPYLNANLITKIALPVPVDKNNLVDQFEVKYANISRVRTSHNEKADIIGLAIPGLYNIISLVEDGNYTWYEVEKDKWMADVPDTTTVILKENTEDINSLKNEISNLKQKIDRLTKENESLKRETIDNNFNIFTPNTTGIYYIQLNKNETLTYKKENII